MTATNDLRTNFCKAIKQGDRARVGALLDQDSSLIDTFDAQEFDATPITLAAGRGDLEMIDLLLNRGADINRKSAWWAGGFAPIHTVLDTHHDWIAPALIERGAVVDVHAAAGLGMVDKLKAMIDEQPDSVHERGGDGKQALHFAASPEIAKFLLASGAEIDVHDIDHESTPAQWAARHRPNVAAYLVERGAKSDPFLLAAVGDAARLTAVVQADRESLTWRIEPARFPVHGSEAEHIYVYTLGSNATLLHVAARCNQPAVISALNALGADLDIRGEYDDCTPLHLAAWEGAVDAINALVDGGAPVDVRSGKMHQNEPLGWAIVSGQVESVRALLDRKAPVHKHHTRQAQAGLTGEFLEFSRRPIESWEQIVQLLQAT